PARATSGPTSNRQGSEPEASGGVTSECSGVCAAPRSCAGKVGWRETTGSSIETLPQQQSGASRLPAEQIRILPLRIGKGLYHQPEKVLVVNAAGGLVKKRNRI